MSEREERAGDLPDHAVVVRGGKMESTNTMRALRKEFEEYGRYTLSVYSIPGLDARQIALRVGSEGLPHGEKRESTVGRVRKAGYHVTISGKEGYAEGHCDLIVPWEPSNEDCDKLLRLFDKKRPRGAR